MVGQELKDPRDTTAARAGPQEPAMPSAETEKARMPARPRSLDRFRRQSKATQAVLAMLALGAAYILFALVFIAVAVSGQQY